MNDKNKEFLVPLHIAPDKAHIEVVEVLLKHGANINSLDCLGQTALHRAAHLGLAQVRYGIVDICMQHSYGLIYILAGSVHALFSTIHLAAQTHFLSDNSQQL